MLALPNNAMTILVAQTFPQGIYARTTGGFPESKEPDLEVPLLRHSVGFIQYQEAEAAHVYQVLLAVSHELPQPSRSGHHHLGFDFQKALLLGGRDPADDRDDPNPTGFGYSLEMAAHLQAATAGCGAAVSCRPLKY